MSYPVMSSSVPWSLVKDGFKKTPQFKTITQKPAAGRGRSTIALMPYPTWGFEVDLNYIPGGEAISGSVLQDFLGCYMECCGGGSFFLFTDPNDNAVATSAGILLNVTPGASAMSQVGDGASTKFQLARSIGTGVDILQNVASVVVYVGGTAVSVTVSATGVVTFATAPATGAALTWHGTFQYLCQFTEDTLTGLVRISKNNSDWLWSCSSIAFESVFV